MWRQFIESLGQHIFFAPAQQSQIDLIRQQLKTEMPDDLEALWLESNGVSAHIRGAEQSVICSTEDCLWRNQDQFRDFPEGEQHFMPFDNLLFFAGDHEGSVAYGYAIARSGDINYGYIYRWDQATGSRTWVALDLKNYLELQARGLLG